MSELTKHFSLPLQGDDGCMKIWDANMRMVADVRGWGYLTGKGDGALGLSEADGAKAQRELMHAIVAAVNALPELIALRETLRDVVDWYDKEHPMRQADWHDPKCRCVRCKFDRARAALNQETDNG